MELLVSYEFDGKTIDNFSYNFSSGGMFIETRSQLPVGSELKLKFELPQNCTEVLLVGRVVWLKKDGAPKGMGIEFTDFT